MSSFLNGKVIESYKTLSFMSAIAFDVQICEHINSGYVPWRNPFCVNFYYCQAMIKFKDCNANEGQHERI